MITDDKNTEIICVVDEFSKKYVEQMENKPLQTLDSEFRSRRAFSMFNMEIIMCPRQTSRWG